MINNTYDNIKNYLEEKPEILSGLMTTVLIGAALTAIWFGAHFFSKVSLYCPNYLLTLTFSVSGACKLLALGGVIGGLALASLLKTVLLYKKKIGDQHRWLSLSNCSAMVSMTVGIALFAAAMTFFAHLHTNSGILSSLSQLHSFKMALAGLTFGTLGIGYGTWFVCKKLHAHTVLKVEVLPKWVHELTWQSKKAYAITSKDL